MTTQTNSRNATACRLACTLLMCLLPAGAFGQGLLETAQGNVSIGTQPFYSVTAQVPSTRAADPETGVPDITYELNFLASPDGQVEGLNAFILGDGERRALCDPIPITFGSPPQTIWLIPGGCDGGGGVPGTLSIDTLVVEFGIDYPEQTTPNNPVLSLSIQEIMKDAPPDPQRLQLPLPLGNAALPADQ